MTAHNPFAPPSADLSVLPKDDSPIRKPRSVWVMQIVAGIVAAWSGYGLTKIGMLAVAGETETRFGVSVQLQLPLQTAFVALMLLMLWQLPKRSKTGRNIGLGFIALLIGLMVMRLLDTEANAWPELLGVGTAAFIILAPLVYWAFAFGFSEKARRYFSEEGRG